MFYKEKKEKKLFPSAEPKAALLIRKSSSLLQKKVERAGMCSQACPMGKNYFKRFLYNMYRTRCKSAPQIQNSQQYLKTNRNRDGSLASPHKSLGGYHQAEI